MWLEKQELNKQIALIVLVAVVVIATLQQAWDHSTYITVTMTAIATVVVQATLTLTTKNDGGKQQGKQMRQQHSSAAIKTRALADGVIV